MQFGVRTDPHDLYHKMKKVNEFLDAGERVKLIVKFKGREMAHKEKLGNNMIDSLIGMVKNPHLAVGPITEAGRTISVQLVVKKH